MLHPSAWSAYPSEQESTLNSLAQKYGFHDRDLAFYTIDREHEECKLIGCAGSSAILQFVE